MRRTHCRWNQQDLLRGRGVVETTSSYTRQTAVLLLAGERRAEKEVRTGSRALDRLMSTCLR